ncbi:expressed protein [Dictyostelium purpureum]|uniref:Expressed protein n=1 Tax=Dictyostelium purpureum TaxID=5786 RepID=F0Z6E7_DICPU|nr:uncharacterized protein DICPUDRAFT_91018 [Dictyostelium purpureum]EGC40474.1 expressed protein [Dictyostelium purpureum]|eukprot:XP_003283021.1 expressed protein [Dictyostelium purpureum]
MGVPNSKISTVSQEEIDFAISEVEKVLTNSSAPLGVSYKGHESYIRNLVCQVESENAINHYQKSIIIDS